MPVFGNMFPFSFHGTFSPRGGYWPFRPSPAPFESEVAPFEVSNF
jgi:hypothetical protein